MWVFRLSCDSPPLDPPRIASSSSCRSRRHTTRLAGVATATGQAAAAVQASSWGGLTRGPPYAVPLIYSPDASDRFYVPENVYLNGTMKTADRSLAMVDYAPRHLDLPAKLLEILTPEQAKNHFHLTLGTPPLRKLFPEMLLPFLRHLAPPFPGPQIQISI